MSIIDTQLQNEIQQRMDFIELKLPKISRRLVELQAGTLDINTKSSNIDLVTNADLESEKYLKQTIESEFCDDHILAEESGLQKKQTSSKFTWILDPIDGTINYAHGLPLFGISVGLTYDQKPVAGIVDMPALGDIYKAISGKGAFKNNKKIQVTQNKDFSQSLIVTGFPYSRKKHLPELMQGISNILNQARGLRRTGSAVIDICWLAEGRFDCHYELQLSPWDTCAASVILIEAGGKITDFEGKEWNVYMDNFAASNACVHDDLIRCIQPLLACQ